MKRLRVSYITVLTRSLTDMSPTRISLVEETCPPFYIIIRSDIPYIYTSLPETPRTGLTSPPLVAEAVGNCVT